MSENPPILAITGTTGFVGRHVLREAITRGYRPRVLVRDPGRLPEDVRDQVQVVQGDLFDPAPLDKLTQGAAAVIHLVGIIMEKPSRGQSFERVHVTGTANLLGAAHRAGVGRWVQMSALGSRLGAPSTYHRSKFAAEEAVRQSAMAWTIFQPSIIHGPDGEFMLMMRDFWTRWLPPFVPYFGGGLLGLAEAGRLQPVDVRDVARLFVQALTTPASVGKTYCVVGPQAMTWPQLYRLCARHLPGARRKPIVPVPAWLAGQIGRLPLPGLPFNRDQVLMSQEDSVGSPAAIMEDFAIAPRDFEQALRDYAPQMG